MFTGEHHDATLGFMRTTITLEEDAFVAIKEEMLCDNGKTFKKAVNDLIRRGGHARKNLSGKKPRRKLPTFDMGSFDRVNYDKPRDLIDELEGTFHR